MDLPGYRPIRKARRAELEPVIAAIRASKKPFIYAGGGVTHSGAAAELKEFAELTGIPVGLTVHGLGNFPADHYLCLQMLGMHGTVYSNYAINDADLLLALGVRFDDRVTGKLTEFAKHGKIVHVDIDRVGDPQEQVRPRPGPRRPEGRAGTTSTRCSRRTKNADLVGRRPLPRLVAADRRVARGRPAAVRRTGRTRSSRSTPSRGCGRSSATASSSTTRSSRPASASTRCGRRSSSTSTSRGSGSPAAAWARWASACRRRSGRRWRTRTTSSSTSTATAAS